MLKKALADPNPEVRATGISTLAGMSETPTAGTPVADEVFALLLSALRDETPDVKCSAIVALSESGDARAFTPLVEMLHDSMNSVRSCAALALARLDKENAVLPLLPLLSDSDKHVRHATAKALWQIADKWSADKRPADKWSVEPLVQPLVQALVQALADAHRSVRLHAIVALGLLGDSRAVEPLCRQWDKEDSTMQTFILRALGDLRDPSAIPLLCQKLENKDLQQHIRCGAAQALGKIGDPSTAATLRRFVDDEDWGVRMHSKGALDKISQIPMNSKQVAVLVFGLLVAVGRTLVFPPRDIWVLPVPRTPGVWPGSVQWQTLTVELIIIAVAISLFVFVLRNRP